MQEFVKKNDIVMDAVNKYPEIAKVLGESGLHCVGCHVSTVETIEEGCLGHGMSSEEIDELMQEVNLRIEEYNKLPKITFTQNAQSKLKEKLSEKKAKFIKIVPSFGGFDFEAVNEKDDIDVEFKDNDLIILAHPKIERSVRDVKVDYSEEKRDFIALE